MGIQDLPAHPSKGRRRSLDRQWLEKLHREGRRALPTRPREAPPELEAAIGEFNRGQYWQCHETLEGLWLPEPYPTRLFFHGLIKAAVGLLHLGRHNRRSAESKLDDAVYTLAPFEPGMMSVDVRRLRDDIMRRLTLFRNDRQDDRFPGWDAVDRLPPVVIRRSSR